MQKSITKSSLITISLLILLSIVAAQTRRPAGPAAPNIASYLPPSDGVAIVDAKRLLNETMPRILGGDPAKLAQGNAEVDKFKARTGIDLHSFERVALGVHYTYPNAKTTKLETVAIAHGSFNAAAVAASVQSAGSGKTRQEKYRGVTITVVNVNDDITLLGLWTMHVNELAVAVLDQNSMALGSPESVRAAINAGKAGRAPADLIALATRDQAAVIGFGGNVTRELLAQLEIGNDTIAKDVSSIRQVYGSLRSTQTDVTMNLNALTDSPTSATNLKDTVDSLRQIGGIFIMRMAEPRKSLAESALNNLKVTARGNELEISTQVTAASLAALVK